MSGIPLIIAFVIAIALMIFAISKLKIHPFLSIMTISLIFAIIAGIPLTDIPDVIGTGFSNTFKSIGIVIIPVSYTHLQLQPLWKRGPATL